jgi:hypothetical protein
MLFGSYEELEACLQLLCQLRSEAAADLRPDNEGALVRYLALQGLVAQYENYVAFARHFFRGRRPQPPEF